MRIKNKIMEKDGIKHFLDKAFVGHLGTVSGNDYPLITPVHFIYYDNKIIIHSGKRGHKINNIINNQKVCFEIDEIFKIVKSEKACDYTSQYCSVIMLGKAAFVKNLDKKVFYLEKFINKYSNSYSNKLDFQRVENTVIIAIELYHISGRKNLC